MKKIIFCLLFVFSSFFLFAEEFEISAFSFLGKLPVLNIETLNKKIEYSSYELNDENQNEYLIAFYIMDFFSNTSFSDNSWNQSDFTKQYINERYQNNNQFIKDNNSLK